MLALADSKREGIAPEDTSGAGRLRWVGPVVARACGAAAVTSLTLAAPLDGIERAGVLVLFVVGFSIGIFIAPLRPLGAKLVGLTVLALALLPSFTTNLIWLAFPVVILGFASIDLRVMLRAVLALPIVLASFAFNAGVGVSAYPMVVWAVFAFVALLVVNYVTTRLAQRQLSSSATSTRDITRSTFWRENRPWRRPLSALAAVVLVSPVAVFAGYSADIPAGYFTGQPGGTGSSDAQSVSYPGFQGSLDVGSPVELSGDVVLRVESARPYYWRAATYENWDGRTWTSAIVPGELESSTEPIKLGSAAEEAVDVPTIELRQRFRTEAPGIDVILGAPQIDQFVSPTDSVRISSDGSIRLPTRLDAGSEWTVQSSVADANQEVLRSAAENGFPDKAFLTRYATEDNVAQRVADLAAEITADAATTYDKVTALERWMDQNLAYDRNIPILGQGEDAVDNLLFESKIGFCEQIGSALVVMLRSLGIPARIAVGYVPGEYDDSTGEWLSRGFDAHTWAEVYFPGVGWQGFDPTAEVPLASTAPSESTPTESVSALLLSWATGPPRIGAAAAICTALLGAFGVLRWRRKRKCRPALTLLQVSQQKFDACGDKLDRSWDRSMTLSERAKDLIASGLDEELVSEVAESLQRFHYSPAGSVDEQLVVRTSELIAILEKRCELVDGGPARAGSAELVG